ncbi:MAG: UvrD-helicase domain-containing protein [Clostridia bacterium]
MNPNKEQQKLIDAEGNTIVSASAGSGKTSTIVAKIIKILKEKKAKINELLVLTYTNSASAEMKSRLEKELSADENLQEELEKLQMSDICTFHSFCQKIVKRNFFVTGKNPNFEIASQEMCKQMMGISADRAIFNMENNSPEDLLYLIEIFGKNEKYLNIKNNIFKIFNYQNQILNIDWQKQTTELCFNNLTCEDILNENLINKINKYIGEFNYLINIANETDNKEYIIYLNNLLSNLSKITIKNTFLINLIEIFNLSFDILKNNSTDLYTKIFNVREGLKKNIEELNKKKLYEKDKILQSYFNCKKLTDILFNLKDLFAKEYQKEKNVHNVMDFFDLEKNTLEILENDELCLELKQYYKYIFIDEFQDANEIQEKILQKLENGFNRIMVGDVKQCIYAFRQSNPQIFLDKMNEFENKPNSQVICLKQNFRSHQHILEFVNKTFSAIMTEQTTGINYKNFSLMECGEKFLEADLSPKVQINLIEEFLEKANKLNKVYSVMDATNVKRISSAEKEAMLVAQRILSLVGSKIYDAKNKNFRELKFCDFCVLMRKRGPFFEKFISKLASLGIPTAGSTSNKLFEEDECAVLINLLMLASNPNNDLALATVLLRLCNFNVDELAQIRLAFMGERFFFSACKKYSCEKADNISKKLIDFYSFINEFRFRTLEINIYSALLFANEQKQIINKFLAYDNGEIKMQNIESFFNYFANNDITLTEFLNNFEVLSPTSPNFCSDSNVVVVSTMHSSKGLEFPVVFLCNLEAEFYTDDHSREIRLSKVLGLVTQDFDMLTKTKSTSIFYEASKILQNKEEYAERVRLLYVAFTRAINRLELVGTLNFDGIKKVKIETPKSYTDMILSAFSYEELENIQNKIDFKTNCFEVNITKNNDFDFKNISKVANNGYQYVDNSELIKTLKFEYPFKDSTKVAYKNSVSALVSEDYFSNKNYIPKTLTTIEHLQNIEKSDVGIAYHKIFEICNFEKTNSIEDVDKLLKNLEESNVFPKLIISQISAQKVWKVVELCKPIICGKKFFKEKKFILKVLHNSVVENGVADQVLIQGIIDLFVFDKTITLIDYKLTNLSEELIIEKYKKQIELYKIALEGAFCKKVENAFVVDINKGKLIKFNL